MKRSLTPTQLAYRAWLNTPRPIDYQTRDDKGNDKTVAIDLLHPESHAHYDASAAGQCLVCGADIDGGVPAARMLGSSYTDWGIHKAPHATHLCKACVWAMMMNTATGRQALFRYSFVADETLSLCNRVQMRDALLSPPKTPFVAVIAVSQKKHLLTKSTISYKPDKYYCMMEEERINVSLDEFSKLIKIIEALRGMGCTKDEIGNAKFRYERLQAWGMDNFERVIGALLPYLRKPLMRLALHVAQKTESEEECICNLDFRPKT